MAYLPRTTADEGAVHPLLAIAGFVLVAVASVTTAYTWTSAFTADRDEEPLPSVGAEPYGSLGREAWIEILVRGGRAVEASDVDVHLLGPEGTDLTTACGTPSLSLADEACADPLQAGDTISRAHSLWAPCLGEGTHLVTVNVEGYRVLETEVECAASAPGR